MNTNVIYYEVKTYNNGLFDTGHFNDWCCQRIGRHCFRGTGK